jgi:hypothetical protein
MIHSKCASPFAKNRKNQKGLLVIDFIFSIVLSFGMLVALFYICYGLVVIEVAQYITYATARAYAAGDKSIAAQTQSGRDKYKELLAQDLFENMFKGGAGWFLLPDESGVSLADHKDLYPATRGNMNAPFVGARVELAAPIFNVHIPFLGKPFDNDDDLKFNLTAFLGREPSFDECRAQILQRGLVIKGLDSRFSTIDEKAYIPTEDNGC